MNQESTYEFWSRLIDAELSTGLSTDKENVRMAIWGMLLGISRGWGDKEDITNGYNLLNMLAHKLVSSGLVTREELVKHDPRAIQFPEELEVQIKEWVKDRLPFSMEGVAVA